MRRNLQSHDS